MTTQDILIRLFNPVLKIDLAYIRKAWLLDGDSSVKLNAQVHRGASVYRLPGSGSAGKKKNIIKVFIPDLPF